LLRVIAPKPHEIAIIQRRDGHHYWSAFAPTWLRKWGIIPLTDESAPCPQDFLVVLRDAGSPSDFRGIGNAALLEGPLDPAALDALGISAETRRAQVVRLDIPRPPASDWSGVNVDWFGYPIVRVRQDEAAKPSQIVEYQSDDPLWRSGAIPIQIFNVDSTWQPVLWAELDRPGEVLPVAVSNGRQTVLGLPLFDLLGRKHASPPLAHRYHDTARCGVDWVSEVWLRGFLVQLAVRAGTSVAVLDCWPEGHASALTVRHDYDRLIPHQVLTNLLGFHDRLGIKCSVGFLHRLLPSAQIRMIRERGHEVVLHAEAWTFEAFAREHDELWAQTGLRTYGVTAHGGAGSGGYLGGTQFDWADTNGFEHAEGYGFGLDTLLPHPVLLSDGEQIRLSSALAMPFHQPLDTGTLPEAHRLRVLRDVLPLRLAAGGLVTVMNHPDIHGPQLKRLLVDLNLDHVWCATHLEVARWTRATRFAVTAARDPSGDGLSLRFQEPLSGALGVNLLQNDETTRFVVPAGQTEATLRPPRTGRRNLLGLLAEAGRQWIGGSGALAGRCCGSPPPTISSGDLAERAGRFVRNHSGFTATVNRTDAAIAAEQSARLGAVISRNVAMASAFADAGLPLPEDCPPATDLRAVVQMGGVIGLGADWSEPSNLYHLADEDLFSFVVVSDAVRMFDDPWGAALLRRACLLTKPDGTVVVPIAKGSRRRALSMMAPEQMDELIGQIGEPSGDGAYRAYRRPPVPPSSASVFDWYVSNHARLAGKAVAVAECLTAMPTRPSGHPTLLAAVGREIAEPVHVEDAAQVELARLRTAIGEASYLIGGLAYKPALVANILRTHFGAEHPIRFLDVGGGFGGLGAELLIAPNLNVVRALTRDLAPHFLVLACDLYADRHDQYAGRLAFSYGAAEEFDYAGAGPFDAVAFIGSLLYVAKDRLHATLQAIWDAITPGGLLIIHENIKAPSYERDYDLMFEPEELDAVLSRFGPIRYFSSNALLEMQQEAVQRRNVFRAVTKALN